MRAFIILIAVSLIENILAFKNDVVVAVDCGASETYTSTTGIAYSAVIILNFQKQLQFHPIYLNLENKTLLA
jgi:hypothetical protein